MLSFRTIDAHPALGSFVKSYWSLQRNADNDHTAINPAVPDGYPEIVFSRNNVVSIGPLADQTLGPQSAALIGQLGASTQITAAPYDTVFFVKLFPWAPFILFGTPMHLITDRIIELSDLRGLISLRNIVPRINACTSLESAAQLLDDFFLRRLGERSESKPIVRTIITEVYRSAGQSDLGTLVRNRQTSLRYVQMLFKEHIGLTPKQFSRIIRVKKASILLTDTAKAPTISSIAHELAYFDHAHFIKDFKAITSFTPSQFRQAATMDAQITERSAYHGQWDYS